MTFSEEIRGCKENESLIQSSINPIVIYQLNKDEDAFDVSSLYMAQ